MYVVPGVTGTSGPAVRICPAAVDVKRRLYQPSKATVVVRLTVVRSHAVHSDASPSTLDAV
jgi:hypothetical protein